MSLGASKVSKPIRLFEMRELVPELCDQALLDCLVG